MESRGGPPPEAWTAAAQEITRALDGGGGASDCREIVVAPDRDGADVRFTTLDGRVARRRIARPSELHALVGALIVGSPDTAVAEHATEPEPDPPTPAPASEDLLPVAPSEPRHADSTPAVSRERAPVRVFASGGVSTSGAEDHAAPVVQVAVTTGLKRWDVGVLGLWHLEHHVHDVAGRRTSAESVGGGVLVGRREPVGGSWIVYGADVVALSTTVEQRLPRREESQADPRAGAYLGLVVPVSPRFRIRGDLGGELALRTFAVEASGLPPPRPWSARLTLGVETGVLP